MPARAAAPAATSEVNQTPPAGSTVAAGTVITYTATITLSAGQASSLTIQMSGDSNLTDRTLTCTSSTNGAADTSGPGGAPSCMWNGPVVAGTFAFVFTGKAGGAIANLLPGSVVCTDTNSTNTCNDEAAGDRVALTDSTADVGSVSVAAAPPAATSQVTQVPPGGSTVAYGTTVTFTVTVSLTVGQVLPLTIQLRGQDVMTNRTLSCTSSANGVADVIGSGGAPSCMWNGPVLAGTFTFIFAGKLEGPLEDSVPHATSVVCTDANSSNTCSDDDVAARVALADSDGDVGPLAVIPGPSLTSEVNQAPDGGTTIANGAPVSYTVSVTLTTGQANAFTIQLAGDVDLAGRTLTCTSSTNGTADTVAAAGTPGCMWTGPVAAGTFTFTLTGTASGAIGDAVPAAASVACTDINSNNTCADEAEQYVIPLDDSDGDVGALPFETTFTITLMMVAKD